jgi:glycosyltransferase involved in cell wall biosynthesis
MRVLVLNTLVPFVWGGAEGLALDLVRHLRAAGAEAELLRIPFRWFPSERLLDEMLAMKSLRLEGVDRVIGLKFPTYLVPHCNKVMWLIHQHRQAYDMWDTGQSDIPRTARGAQVRQAIYRADASCFAECKALYAISSNVALRLRHYNRMDAGVLHMPLSEPERFSGGAYGDYIFAGGRLATNKRQELLIRAMRHVRAPVRLVVAGPPDSPLESTLLRDLIDRLDLTDRVILDARFLPIDELAGLMNNALAAAYVPQDEDAIGYVTMEACQAAKPVIACTDSGGLLELLQDGVTGYVVPPEPEAIAEAIDTLATNRALAHRLGHQAHEALQRMDITWHSILSRLLS